MRQLHLQLKEIPEIYIAYVRQQGLADQEAFMRRFSELNTLCRKNNLEPIGNIMARYYDDYQQYDRCADVEVSIQIDLNHEIGGVVRKNLVIYVFLLFIMGLIEMNIRLILL
ncbi:MAG: hypothetical protein ACLRQF_05155 [Thomasclavelia ramosa]